MISFSNAKINLGLRILRRRSDGYHELETTFYPIPWYDVLEITHAESLEFVSTGLTIPGDMSSNLVMRAYTLLHERFELPSVRIHLHKTIPMGAGLGGGSSNAAFTIKSLNHLFDLGLNAPEMEDLARTLGADCAFFIKNDTAWARGRGDQLKPISLSLDGWILVLAIPPIHISTKRAFDGIEIQKQNITSIKESVMQPVDTWKSALFNDFEISLLREYSTLGDLKHFFYESGASFASLSGSGSAVFGLYPEMPDHTVFDAFGNRFAEIAIRTIEL